VWAVGTGSGWTAPGLHWGGVAFRTFYESVLVPEARPEFRVSRIFTENAIIQSHTVRERLLATLARFFAIVALLLAAVGLYGVLHYSVLQRRREIGIRIALGATSSRIATVVSKDIVTAILIGVAAGAILSFTASRAIESILYQVKPTDISILMLPTIILAATAAIATTPAILRATKIDPANLLRTD